MTDSNQPHASDVQKDQEADPIAKRVGEVLTGEFKGVQLSTAIHALIKTAVRLVFTSRMQEGREASTEEALDVLIDALRKMKENSQRMRGAPTS